MQGVSQSRGNTAASSWGGGGGGEGGGVCGGVSVRVEVCVWG